MRGGGGGGSDVPKDLKLVQYGMHILGDFRRPPAGTRGSHKGQVSAMTGWQVRDQCLA